MQEIAPQLAGIRRFAAKVQLVVQIGVELSHHFAWLEALAVGKQALQQPGHCAQQCQILFNDRQNAWAQNLDRDFLAVRQFGEVYLCHGCAGDRGGVKFVENLLRGPAIGADQDGTGLVWRNRRHPVLQLGQFIGQIRRQDVAPGG